MILMALDHTRDYFTNLRFPPEDLSRATPALFATRWITHFCAPSFFLLAGVGASLAVSGGKSVKQISWFLFTRGLWLVLLEMTIMQVAWNFAIGFPLFLIVIWALGWSMVVLSGLVFLPRWAIAIIAIGMIAGHNLLDGITPASLGSLGPLWNFLHVPGFVFGKALIAYPLIPWCGVMALGYVLGAVFRWEAAARRGLLVQAGIAMVIGFVILRYFNLYGNPTPWTPQKSTALTVASFLNVLKYPPSLMFLLMTLGPALIALAFFEKVRGSFARVISVYGRVPMFYFIVHIFVIHILAYAFAVAQGGRGDFISLDTGSFPAWYGTGLPGVYLTWAVVILILYLPCRWYANLKSRRKDLWWLGYI
ncbi:MAG TPA: heparan-alpha-glucosaminide N-acetyltransferase domain-containing protein, partial [Gemmatimonadaceae bacterium]|nr:heparan-alpha-glucosaminide N-acetyltransferase domain-containing protein [Gemmatimonadaceae bacterium]